MLSGAYHADDGVCQSSSTKLDALVWVICFAYMRECECLRGRVFVEAVLQARLDFNVNEIKAGGGFPPSWKSGLCYWLIDCFLFPLCFDWSAGKVTPALAALNNVERDGSQWKVRQNVAMWCLVEVHIWMERHQETRIQMDWILSNIHYWLVWCWFMTKLVSWYHLQKP